jgi:hypothetical protein
MKSYVHMLPRFTIAKTVLSNLKMLENSHRTSADIIKDYHNTFPVKPLEDRILGILKNYFRVECKGTEEYHSGIDS